MFTTKNLIKLIGKHALITFSVIGLTFIFIVFISGEITKISEGVARDRQLATLLSERTTLLYNLKKEVDIVGQNESIIKQAFVPSNNILSFVAILESIAIKNGVTQTFHFSSPVAWDVSAEFPIEKIVYQNSISSNISTFIRYLEDFESLPYFTKIDSINIASTEADWRTKSTSSFGASVATKPTQ